MTIFIPWTSFDRDKDELELLNENATKEEIISSSSAIVLFTSAIHGRRIFIKGGKLTVVSFDFTVSVFFEGSYLMTGAGQRKVPYGTVPQENK